MSVYYTRILILLSLACISALSQSVSADIFLTSENLNTSLKQMQRSQLQIQNEEDHETALYTLGKTADDLARLLTDEVEAHSNENEKLIELALNRTNQIQISIEWVGHNSSFYYDGKALYEYLTEYPDGEFTMDVRYRIITREFYLAAADNEKALTETIEFINSFIDEYPEFEKLSEIELFLAIDYRDLWRLYSGSQNHDKAIEIANIARNQFQAIIDKHKDRDESEIATRLLDRFLIEANLETLP